MQTSEVAERWLAIYNKALVWDAHAGVFPGPEVDLSLLDAWHELGVNYLSINVGFDVLPPQMVLATLAAYRRYIMTHRDSYVLVDGIADIDQARREGNLAVSFDIEGMNALDRNIDMVDFFHALGVRQMLFAYNLNNCAAGGCHDEDTGLTDFGKAIVDRMNEVGMIVDCSHAGYRTSMDLIACSRDPVVFTHSNPTAVWQHKRNINDEQIKACAATGGVVGINGMGIFLGKNDVSVDTFARHVSYVADLVGPEHVGFGLDWKPERKSMIDIGTILRSRPDYWPAGQAYDTPEIRLFGPDSIPILVENLHDKGWREEDLVGFLGGNFHRVAAEVWQA